jgi:hypothetical protein
VERVLEAFTREVHDLYGPDLVAVVLYGSAATGEHVAGASDINVAVILRQVTSALLRKASGRIRAWHRQGFATPLFFDPEGLQRSLDVFPIEFLDMQERHRILWGSDLLAPLRVGRGNLRLQCEQELRGKLLRLRQAYVESAGSPDELRRTLLVAAGSVLVLLRTLLRLAGGEPGGPAEVVLERAGARFATSTAHLAQVYRVKRGESRLAGSALDTLFQGVLGEVENLVRVVDELAA